MSIDMRRLFVFLFCLLTVSCLSAQTKPLYRLPENTPSKADDSSEPYLVGTDSGLYQISAKGQATALWTEGKVTKILKTNVTVDSKEVTKWYFVTSKGIVSSYDLISFTECNNGLPVLTIKEYADGKKSLVNQSQLLKDLCVDPLDQNILVTATKDAVYITRDGGAKWTSLSSTSKFTAGIKAAAVAHMPVYASDGSIQSTKLTVFMSHSIYGFSYCYPDNGATWTDVSKGFGFLSNLTQPDEISDILPVLCSDSNGKLYVEIYCANSYMPKVYRFDWKNKKAVQIYSGKGEAESIDSLCQAGNSLYFVMLGEARSISLTDGSVVALPKEYSTWKNQLYLAEGNVNTAYVPAKRNGLSQPLQLNELWMLQPDISLSKYGETATDKKAVYISAYQVRNMTGINKYKGIVKNNKLNAVVVDMKDDYGVLRFTPNSELLKKKGFVSAYKIDVEQFVSEFKKDDVYLVARIVVFKDKHLSEYGGGKYAVWNYNTGKAWVGTKDSSGTLYDENWVDPYCEEVWEYNVEIAKELIQRGFDEVQFDYIRFPTDGLNLGSASYRWKEKGMDKESAIMSFLSYARKNIDAPIGIDIYGANGWYRSGTRTGQDVEMLSEYVDIICPMFYPSHFEQNFLESSPVIERPYRIYFYGTYRNMVIGRNRIIVRPWVQAFYMGVRYDRTYYDKNYVKREVFGVRDSVNRGYMYWNNSGGMYDDISPDPGDAPSPWKGNEADLQYKLPAFSSSPELRESNTNIKRSPIASAPDRDDDMISIFNSVLYPVPDTYDTKDAKNASAMLLSVDGGKGIR